MTEMLAYAYRMARAMAATIHSTPEDVVGWLKAIAALEGEGKTLEFSYKGIVLHVRHDSCVKLVVRRFERELMRTKPPGSLRLT